MLDGVVFAELGEVESAAPVRAFEEVGGEVRDEEAEGRGEVEGLVDCGLEIAESDVAAGAGQDAVVGLLVWA